MKEEGELKLTPITIKTANTRTLFMDINNLLYKAQSIFIERRLRFPWKYWPFNHLAARQIHILFTKPEVSIEADEATITQQVVVIGSSLLWALILLKREK